MTDWRTMETKPEGVFDVLARRYDAGLNRFTLHRFTSCILQDMTILLCSPWPQINECANLEANGFRVVAWRPAPGPEDIPEWLEEFASGPKDRKE